MYARLKYVEVDPINVPECFAEILDMHLPSLEHLDIAADVGRDTVDMADIVNSGPWNHLTTLCIRGYQLGRYSMAAIEHAGWPHLKELDLTSSCMDAEAVRCLTKCSWPCLESLSLAHNDLDHDAVLHLICADWPCLSSLNLCKNRLCNASIQALIKGNWPNLASLDLAENKIDYDALKTLLQGRRPELAELCLEDTNIYSNDAFALYGDAASVESCVFGHLLQRWCDIHSSELAQGFEPDYGASLGCC